MLGDSSSKSSVLVTGGAGYVGSHACKALANAGFTPVTYDNLFRGHNWAAKWGPLEIGDIADTERVRIAIRRHRVVAVLHFAACAYAGESVAKPALYYGNNVAGSWSLLEAMRAEGVAHIVFSSSCSVYGDGEEQPMSEATPFQPVSPYGFSKLAVERMIADYGHAYGLKSVSLRYFNASGADSMGDIGELHDPETHLIPIVLEVAAGERPYLEIFGGDYATPDGTCIRDYIHVSDLAEAHVLALNKLMRVGVTGAFNLGTGRGHSVNEVVAVARQVTGNSIPVVIRSRRLGDPRCAVADARLAGETLGWSPRYTQLSEIIETAWRWKRRDIARIGHLDPS